jgi:hypothetical protein
MTTTSTTSKATKAVYSYTVRSPAGDNFGAIDYTTTETLTVQDGGLLVAAHSVGICEGRRVDQKTTKFYPGASLEDACDYRDHHGYRRIEARDPNKVLQQIPMGLAMRTGIVTALRFTRSGYQLTEIDGTTYKTLFDARTRAVIVGVQVRYKTGHADLATDSYPEIPYADICEVMP